MSIPGATVHWYDKPGDLCVSCSLSFISADCNWTEIRKQRKMGHITIVGPSLSSVEKRLEMMVKEKEADYKPPSMVAALTPLPVIGVPMPRGVPVATVAINNAMNAGLLAVMILGVVNDCLISRMIQYLEDTKESVSRKAEKLEKDGWESY
ncbi:hypothetical protein L6164_010592 [Bauhinia variegata]|uniref:Uncharacterized protein n=1 Tax=Bauhinia variegata TaxID=167791 RepID=A0ACB9PMW6_BAUVA|nr:hypothetical protein L6164_010592 [Bauhinia variegata]